MNMITTLKRASLAGSLAALASVVHTPGHAATETVAAIADSQLDEVIVTGTRQTDVTVANSPAPIQIVSAQQLQSVAGSGDLISALAKIVPSFTAQGFGSDQGNNVLLAKLRGLSPNDTLILINGKRRHTTSSLAVGSGPYQGGAGTDLNFIPVEAIDHIEVLTEGAAAQYGSDAIAGVINIILKKDNKGGSVGATYGQYEDGGGITSDYTANIAFEPIADSYFDISAEVHNHGHSDRGSIDGRTLNPNVTYPNSNWTQVPGYPHLNLIEGDAQYNLKIISFNSGFDLGSGVELYAFGTYGRKTGSSYENYRTPNTIVYPAGPAFVNPAIDNPVQYGFPLGFTPSEDADQTDYEATAGVKGEIAAWHWDLSSSYGTNKDIVSTVNSANAALYGGYTTKDPNTGVISTVLGTDTTPTDFYDGFFKSTQWTSNLDISRDFSVGLAAPLNVAFGGEYRRNTFQIGAGDPASYLGSGAQSFPGFLPVDAGTHARTNYAGYIDLATKPVDGLQTDLAGRLEHYSDFGSKGVGKLTARYDIVPEFAVRGTVSTGFRAPTLAEEYYTTTNVSPDSATVQLQPNSKAATDLGLGNLRPETSTNYTAGVVFKPTETLLATLDAYQINIHNRIVSSGTLNSVVNGTRVGTPNANGLTPIEQAILDSGNQSPAQIVPGGSYSITLFTNGIDTRTRGADFALDLPVDYGVGKVDWSLGASYNETTVTNIRGNPVALTGQPLFATGSVLYDQTALSDITSASPKYLFNLGALLTWNRLTVNLREQVYGASTEYVSNGGHTVANPNGSTVSYLKNEIGVTPITNLDVSYEALAGLRLSVGAVNLLNRYPNKVNGDLLAGYAAAYNRSTVNQYPSFSPYGFNGGFYYLKATYRF
jgi:iron complex outermembrane recepter protein